MRVEHEDHAKSHGGRVGANMAGATGPTTSAVLLLRPLRLGYEAVGRSSTRDWTRSLDGTSSTAENIYYYLDGSTARRYSLWNRLGQIDDARELIRAGKPVAKERSASVPAEFGV